MANAKILVADDHPGLLTLLKRRLQSAGYQVTLTGSGEEALARAQEALPDLAIVDLKMAGMDGMALMQRLLQLSPTLPVIILTAHGTIPNAVEATKQGAYDYLAKPFESADLLHRIEKALELRHLQGENAQLRTLVQDRYHVDNIVAASGTMQRVLQQVAQIAATEATVALYGESGTGKELIAKALHAASRRVQGPFIALNCGAIPEGLLENELFGHVKGAYTGADQAKRGLLQQADGGTLFLDEIAELSPALQVKLLRVLQEYEFAPLGAERSVQVDFRLIAATNQDLWKAVGERRFREDLYYRVHVIPVVLPPLRERPEDIPLLAQHYLHRFGQELHKDVQGFAPEAMQRLMRYDWPGNVRELTNVVERAVVLAPHRLITPDLLLLESRQRPGPHTALVSFQDARDDFERRYLIQALTATKGNVARAAARAGKHRADFYKLLRKHGLDPGRFKADTSA
jgi:two-component system response regulator GlrR